MPVALGIEAALKRFENNPQLDRTPAVVDLADVGQKGRYIIPDGHANNLKEVNDAPVVLSESVATVEDVPLLFDAASSLKNDSDSSAGSLLRPHPMKVAGDHLPFALQHHVAALLGLGQHITLQAVCGHLRLSDCGRRVGCIL
jgi:hypothetical protein